MKKNSPYPKIIILGIDGLEYSLVEKWKLTHIMQKTYGKLDLSDYDIIVTPPIWGSMLTGKIDKEVMDIWIRQAKITGGGGGKVKQKWWTKVGNIVPPFIDLWIWDHIFAPLLGGNSFEKTANYIIEKNERNIFQFFKKPWTNGIPGYGKLVSTATDRYFLQQVFLGKDKPFRELVIKYYKEDKEKLFIALKKQENDLIFWYTMIVDKLGHAYLRKPLTLMKYYLEINELVGKVKNQFRDAYIFIISDHGMELYKGNWGMHSKHGFFSSNTGELIKKPYDLYDLLQKYRTI